MDKSRHLATSLAAAIGQPLGHKDRTNAGRIFQAPLVFCSMRHMTYEDPLPRGTREIDDEIKNTRQQLKDVVRNRRLAFLACVAGAMVEAGFIILAVRGYRHPDTDFWVLFVFFGGIALLVGIVAVVAEAVFADADESEFFDIARATVVKRRIELEQLAAERREILIGNVVGQAVVYARYREAMPELVARYRNQANRYRSSNNALQAFVIVASLITSAITGLFGTSAGVRTGIVGLTLAVAIASSTSTYFRLRERGAQFQKTADEIEIEFRSVELGINDYEGLKKQDALRLFVQKVEELRSEHMLRQRQLDQPADLRFIDPSSISIDRRSSAS